MDTIGTLILAAGALGTTSFGIIEALKWTNIGQIGFKQFYQDLGQIVALLEVAYGSNCQNLLQAKYRGDPNALAKLIRQGARVGMRTDNVAIIADFLGMTTDEEKTHLIAATEFIHSGAALGVDSEDADASLMRNALGKFELAVDARIDAAITQAISTYESGIRTLAALLALVIAGLVGWLTYLEQNELSILLTALLVGIGAVPLAPIANDVAKTIKSLSNTFRGQ